jgi:hypothetical protein
MDGQAARPGLKTSFLLLAIVALAAQPARASEMPIAAQPLVHERGGAVQGCGARLTGGEASPAGSSAWFDVSFNVFRGGVALVQSYAYELRRSNYDGDARPARVPVQSAWLKAPQGSARLGENTERRETLVYPLVLDDALALFRALAAGEKVTVGIKRWDQRSVSVYAGTPELSDEARQRIADCLGNMSE